jgi:hypothetical protein
MMQYSLEHFASTLHRTGFPEVADEALRALPDPVEGDRIGAFLTPYGITLDEIVSRMGGTTLASTLAMEARAGAGAFEAVKPEGFNRAERAAGPYALRSCPARRPGEHRRGERVGIPACQVHHGQRPATGIARHGHYVRPDGLLRAGRRPAALNPARLLL